MVPRRCIFVLLALIALLIELRPSESLAQSRTDKVCWADRLSRCPRPYDGPGTTFYQCGSGGHSGFNPTWVCQQICGSPPGPRCKISTPDISGYGNYGYSTGGSGGRCGYRVVDVSCF